MTSKNMNELESWKCGNCQRNILHDVQEFVHETYEGMPAFVEFYCPACKAVLEIELGWQMPIINYIKVIHTRKKER